MRQLSLKAILSTILILLFLYLAFSGALLYFGKTGMVMGVARSALREIHARAAFLLCVLVPVHFIINHRLYLSELKALFKRKGSEDKR